MSVTNINNASNLKSFWENICSSLQCGSLKAFYSCLNHSFKLLIGYLEHVNNMWRSLIEIYTLRITWYFEWKGGCMYAKLNIHNLFWAFESWRLEVFQHMWITSSYHTVYITCLFWMERRLHVSKRSIPNLWAVCGISENQLDATYFKIIC